MSLSYHLIDGYNLLHAAGLARATYGPGDYERVRYALLIRIADGLDDAARERATVVFDAFDPPPDATARFRFRELTVQFAGDSGDADSLIEELIRRHSSPRQLRVVSDDIRLQRAAKRRGASAVKCDSFLRRLERFAAPQTNPSGRSAGDDTPPAADAADWLAYFGLAEDDAAKEVGKSVESVKADQPTAESRADSFSQSPANSRRKSSQAQPSSTAGGAKNDMNRGQIPPARNRDSETPAEELSFWQRRIEEAFAEERSSRPHRPESS
ncbi:MAG: NYN domain-containing protein [Planctomycetaceae bacterium]